MKFSHWLMGTAMAAMTLPITAPNNSFGLIQTAQADVYHSVVDGDTLSSIAARYHTNVDDLRALNGLKDASATSALPTMLLRVPEGPKGATSNHTAISIPALAPQVASVRESAPAGYGTVTKSVVHVVQPQETTETIAARYAQAGYGVTADTIRTKNNLSAQPSVGQRLLIPLQSQTYRAPQTVVKTAAQTRSGGRSSTSTASNAVVSDEMFIPGMSSMASEVPSKAPVYQSPIGMLIQHARRRLCRGPTVLASRGYSPHRNWMAHEYSDATKKRPCQQRARSRVHATATLPRAFKAVRWHASPWFPCVVRAFVACPNRAPRPLYQCTTGTEWP
jgi:LysM repeat protein